MKYLSSVVILIRNTFISNYNKVQSVTIDNRKNDLYYQNEEASCCCCYNPYVVEPEFSLRGSKNMKEVQHKEVKRIQHLLFILNNWF